MSRMEHQMEQLAERAAAVRELELAYGHVQVERGRQAAVIVHGLVLEWPEAIAMGNELKAQREAAFKLAQDGAPDVADVCLECMGGSADEVKRCTAPKCPLYQHRFGKRMVTEAAFKLAQDGDPDVADVGDPEDPVDERVPEKGCPISLHADDCDCEGAGGDR